MNGRVFDYNVGRFTGVDPFIQFPLNSQSLNPYSYLMNSPLSGTDPTGYYGKFDSVCDRPSTLGACDASVGGGNSTGKVKPVRVNSAENGASSGSTTTTDSRNQSDAKSIAARFGEPALRALLPAVYGQAHIGEPGDLSDHAYNGFAAFVNGGIDALFFVPGTQMLSINSPRMEYQAKGLKTAAVMQLAVFVAGGGRSAASRVGGVADDAARMAGSLANDAAPIIEEIVVTTLRSSVRKTFLNGEVERTVLEQPLTVIRFHGGNAGKVGRFATGDAFTSRVDARSQLAVLQEWGNTFTKKTTVELPAGTEIWTGRAAPQTGRNGAVLPGGGSQIYIDGKLNSSWFKSTEWFRSYKGNN
jgi:hypothetical protein